MKSPTLNIINELNSFEDYKNWRIENEDEIKKWFECEQRLVKANQVFNIEGYDPISNVATTFYVGYEGGGDFLDNGIRVPNYRETLIDDIYKFNSRLRFTVLAFNYLLEKIKNKNLRLYLTEQTTAIYKYYFNNYTNVEGSEYLGNDILSGTKIKNITHQDITHLSYENENFNVIISLEVLEHVPNYEKAFKELYRVLEKGGFLLFSVPFRLDDYETLIRAKVNDDGSINHLLTPEYHGDPVNSEAGILCFQHFGWDVLDLLKKIGFKKVGCLIGWSSEYGIMGGLGNNIWYAFK